MNNLQHAEFDRFDICDAYAVLEWDYNVGGILQERPSNVRRSMSTGFQLHRMGYRPSPLLSYDSMSDNARAIYDNQVILLGLPTE